ncbi:hypothetical protein [Aquabacterium sp.]|uniref:hypothetical protein n=1 Tax=Aquabacterium sp. TaxID=1872578 RepID=UPI003D0192FF
MRQRQIIGALQMLCGLGLWALGLVWLGFCIATIVVGVLVYLFAPAAFLWPFNLGIVPGNAMLVMGAANLFGGSGSDLEA